MRGGLSGTPAPWRLGPSCPLGSWCPEAGGGRSTGCLFIQLGQTEGETDFRLRARNYAEARVILSNHPAQPSEAGFSVACLPAVPGQFGA